MKALIAITAALTLAASVSAHAQPPTVNGVYIAKGGCPFEGCTLGWWRATATVPLFAAPGSTKVVGRVRKGAWVRTDRAEVWLTPWRGVMRRDSEPLKAGDVIYLLDNQGEGFSDVWRRGEILSWFVFGDEADSPVRWDKPLASAPKDVWWVHTRAGWLRNPSDFTCIDQFSGDEGCR
jgi:hypothetical protein